MTSSLSHPYLANSFDIVSICMLIFSIADPASFRYYDSRSNMAQSEPHSHSTYWSIHVVRAKAGTIAMARPE
ncbi:MAG: hypothetical protein WBF33_37160, partial [Candidatus Nitrosopolaris sp.]